MHCSPPIQPVLRRILLVASWFGIGRMSNAPPKCSGSRPHSRSLGYLIRRMDEDSLNKSSGLWPSNSIWQTWCTFFTFLLFLLFLSYFCSWCWLMFVASGYTLLFVAIISGRLISNHGNIKSVGCSTTFCWLFYYTQRCRTFSAHNVSFPLHCNASTALPKDKP